MLPERGRAGRRRGIWLVAFGAAACTCCGGGAPARPAPVPENALRAPAPRLVGRFDASDPAGPKIAWSTSTVEARFAGSGIALRLRAPAPPKADDPPLYTVTVDDRFPQLLTTRPGDRRYTLAEHLDPREPHVVRIVRESEAFAGVHQLLALELMPGGELLPPAATPPRPMIEIVGDSITCGYGVLGEGPACHFSFATERASKAYGALAAAALGADVTTICWSGRGVYRNYDDDSAPTMPALWQPAASPPDAVVVHLGTNDVLTPRAPFDARAFEQAYDAFLRRIRAAYARPWILVAVSPMLEGERRTIAAASLERVVAARHSDGDARVELLVFEPQGRRLGCDAHPNAAMHDVMAKQLAEALRDKLR